MNEFRQQWLATELQLEQQAVAAEKKRKKAEKKEKQRAKAALPPLVTGCATASMAGMMAEMAAKRGAA
jgi:hypothetical protein